MLVYRDLTKRIIGLAIEVHRTIGPGLLGSVYAACLCDELAQAGIPFQQQVGVPVTYKGKLLPLGFRADILVADAVVIEVKAVSALLPAHEAQILTYLRMSHIRVGLLMNFHATRLKDGLRRFIVDCPLRGPSWSFTFSVLRAVANPDTFAASTHLEGMSIPVPLTGNADATGRGGTLSAFRSTKVRKGWGNGV